MNKYLIHQGAFAAVCLFAAAPLSQTVRGADSTPSTAAGRLPINLAHANVGTRLVARAPQVKSTEKAAIEENTSAQALISDDAALTYPLKAGQTSLIVTLSKIQMLTHFNFVNFGAAGKYAVSVSSTKLDFDAPGWRSVAGAESFDAAAVVSADLGSVEARYVKIDITTERPGRIAALGLFGEPVISTYQSKPIGYTFVSGSPAVGGFSTSDSRNVYLDLANLDTGARVVALSRGGDLDAAQSIIDGNIESNYAFDPTDPAPAVVIDFGARRALNRLSCVYEAPPGRLDFYLVDNPYRKDEQRANISYVDEPTLEPVSNVSGEYSGRPGTKGRVAIYSVDTSAQPGLNRLAADLTGQEGRFLVAEFHPVATGPAGDFKDRDFKDQPDFKDTDFKDRAGTPAAQPLRVLSLSAFGQLPDSGHVPQLPPPNTPPNPVSPPVQVPSEPGSEGVHTHKITQ